jgi:hypothetical protein
VTLSRERSRRREAAAAQAAKLVEMQRSINRMVLTTPEPDPSMHQAVVASLVQQLGGKARVPFEDRYSASYGRRMLHTVVDAYTRDVILEVTHLGNHRGGDLPPSKATTLQRRMDEVVSDPPGTVQS